jgi:hypothetical protein
VIGVLAAGRPGDLTADRRRLSAALHDGARPPGADEGAVERLLLAYQELTSNSLRHGRRPVGAPCPAPTPAGCSKSATPRPTGRPALPSAASRGKGASGCAWSPICATRTTVRVTDDGTGIATAPRPPQRPGQHAPPRPRPPRSILRRSPAPVGQPGDLDRPTPLSSAPRRRSPLGRPATSPTDASPGWCTPGHLPRTRPRPPGGYQIHPLPRELLAAQLRLERPTRSRRCTGSALRCSSAPVDSPRRSRTPPAPTDFPARVVLRLTGVDESLTSNRWTS